MLDQLEYLTVDKHARRYSILILVFSLKIHRISPACDRLVRGSKCRILPHGRNLLKIKSSIGLESEYTKILAEVASTINDLECHLILQMDEVHIRSDAFDKEGRVIESIGKPNDQHTTVFYMIVTSLLTKFSSIVQLIPLGSSSAQKNCISVNLDYRNVPQWYNFIASFPLKMAGDIRDIASFR